MATGGSYVEGNPVKVSVAFTVNGAATDPTTVTLKVRSPSGTTITYTYALGEVTKTATGAYNKELGAATVAAVGEWHYRWIGTGTAAGAGEATFRITPSAID